MHFARLIDARTDVSGLTTRVYNDHGRQVLEADARGVTVERFVDELDRVLFIDYPETGLDVRYVYDDPAVAFARGRLSATICGKAQEAPPFQYLFITKLDITNEK